MKIAGVNFPEPLLNTLRDGRLVIFSGAGVSMGPPAGLPGFRQLAQQVAEGTGQSIGTSETEDRFLGRLEDGGIDVHRRAVQFLQQHDPEPTELHRDLLRLYTRTEDVQIVTTNFDPLFEQAMGNLFNPVPWVFQAPALPLGGSFHGIVHVHGSLNDPEQMVLTHRDFGKAYLTEVDGWARRFLVDLFANQTVLFVGYSHNDTIMTYLTPSLPPDDGQRRFALIGDRSDEPERWLGLGIQPVIFHQVVDNDFNGLDAAVTGLASHVRMGLLDWQHEITEIANGPPPIDEEGSSIVEHALSDPALTRFFIRAADSPEWIDWLDRHDQLTALFANGDFTEKDGILSYWLATRFAIKNTDALFRAIERRGATVNPRLWNLLAWQLGEPDDGSLDAETLSRWVHFLLSATPPDDNDDVLCNMAVKCARLGILQELLQLYDALTSNRQQTQPRSGWNKSHLKHYWEETLWQKCLAPNLPAIAESLLERTVRRLEERHFALRAWHQADDTRDPDSSYRSAIEPHPQDRFPLDADMLINIARECVEWLVINKVDTTRLWSERFTHSQAPLLRRLAVHALSVRTDLSADDKIAWLLEHCDVNETRARHEIYRAVAAVYPHAGPDQRQALIAAVLAYRWPWEDDLDDERYSAHRHYDWLQWLTEADPECILVRQALDPIRARHPEFVPQEHPDLTHWIGDAYEVVGKPSPWSVAEMLDQSPAEWLPQALEQQPSEYTAHPRDQIINYVAEATKQNSDWGLELADQMTQVAEWDTHLWRGVINGWCSGGLDEATLAGAIRVLSADALHSKHVDEITDALAYLIGNNEVEMNAATLALANKTARSLWQHITVNDHGMDSDWMERASNHPAGRLTHFWVRSIAIWRRNQEPKSTMVSGEYREALSEIVAEHEPRGLLARATLMSELPFLAFVDEEWTRHNLIPLLAPERGDFASAWDGLVHGRLHPMTVELLREPFLTAVENILPTMKGSTREGFIRKYTQMLIFSVTDANDTWITKLFKHADDADRRLFAMEIGRNLQSLDETHQREWWDTWLRDYWEHRLVGVPTPLSDTEIVLMTEWATNLPGLFPDAVDLAVQMRPVSGIPWLVMHRIRDSGLAERHPCALANLLIHIAQSDSKPWIGLGIKGIVDQLLERDLPTDLKRRLRELAVRHNLQ